MNLITIDMIARAILNGDKTFLNEIKLPSGQGAGTSFQKESYARQKAIKIYNQHSSLIQKLMSKNLNKVEHEFPSNILGSSLKETIWHF